MKIKGFRDTIAWYDQNAEAYAKTGMAFVSMRDLENFSNLLPKQGHILDAGCGAGRDTFLLSQRGFHVVGLDISHGLLSEARKQYPGLTFKEGNFLEIPFADDTFDGVWANASLLHFESIDDVVAALHEFWRVLKKDGIIHVRVKAQTGKEKTAIISDALSKHERFFRFFTHDEMKQLLLDAKFTLVSSLEFSEDEEIKHGRPEVKIIVVLAKK